MRYTLTNFKKFIRENRNKLTIKVSSTFDGMVDCVTGTGQTEYTPIEAYNDLKEYRTEHTMNIRGVWLVGHSRDYFTPFNDETMQGVVVSNCCGSFTLAVQK
jgi:hypothetical protein